LNGKLLFILAAASLCFGADRFVLDAELRTDFTDGSASARFMTGYTYDAQGNRVQQRVWSGTDSLVAPMSSLAFSYNAAGDIAEQLLLSGGDTLSIVRYAYNQRKLIAVHTLNKDGSARFSDSLIYDGSGCLIEEQRLASTGEKTFYHQYTLNASGKVVADSMFELVSGHYTASQAVLLTYNADSTVATEAQWRLSSATWNCITTGFMKYSAGRLVAVATYERDGIGTGLSDSIAYAYDGSGNRTKEEDFDESGTQTCQIDYTWRDTQPVAVLTNERPCHAARFLQVDNQGRLIVGLDSRETGTIAVFDMAGKQIYRMAVDHPGLVSLAGLVGRGSYVAAFTGATSRLTTRFSLYN
jgi:hypothetical protein